ncbi:MAG: hypothetical protein K2L98_01050 [Bacilli bacterium]|nr:hypothetical protein [Bacilli bacterium]
MKLASLKGFYENNNTSTNITLYQEYLASVKESIKEGMEEAKNVFGEDDSFIDSLKRDISTIESLEEIIKNSFKELVNNSIAKMSIEELEGIINEYIGALEENKEDVNKELNSLKLDVDGKVKKYTQEMEQRGYKFSYYEIGDAASFFEDIKSAEDYVMDLVKSDLDKEALKATFSWLYSIDSVQEEFANMILSLRKIANISDDEVLKRAVSTFLTPEKFGKIIGIQDEKECLGTFEVLQKELKMRTEFFECLPDLLKEEIKNNGIVNNSAYNRLKALYLMYKESGEILIPTNTDVQKGEQQIDDYVSKIAGLDSKIERAKAAFESHEKMISLVQSLVSVESDETLSYTSVSKENLELRTKEQELNRQIDELKDKEDNLEQIGYKVSNLLRKKELVSEFEVLNAKREYQMMVNGDGKYADKEVEAIAVAEKRRLDQFKRLGLAINGLNDIKREIEEVNKSRNLWKYVTGENQRRKEELLEKYDKAIKDLYSFMNQENVLRINVSRSYLDGEDEILQKPRNFDDLLANPNVVKYEINYDLFNEMEDKKLFTSSTTRNKVNQTNEILYELACKLFKAEKNLDGTYDFEIKPGEIGRLLELQEGLASLYVTLQSMRETEKKTIIRLAEQKISDEFKQNISDAGLDIDTITKEELEEYLQDVESQISEIRHKLFCLQEELPKDDCITSQYEMLSGLEDTCLSSDEVKKVIHFN